MVDKPKCRSHALGIYSDFANQSVSRRTFAWAGAVASRTKACDKRLLTHSAQETSKIPRASSGGAIIIFGDCTFVPISWIFQHQTARCFTSVRVTDGMNQNVRCAGGNPLELANLAQHNLMLNIASLKVADALNTGTFWERR